MLTNCTQASDKRQHAYYPRASAALSSRKKEREKKKKNHTHDAHTKKRKRKKYGEYTKNWMASPNLVQEHTKKKNKKFFFVFVGRFHFPHGI